MMTSSPGPTFRSATLDDPGLLVVEKTMPKSDAESLWYWLYRAGGTAALLALAVFRRHFGMELVVLMEMGVIHMEPPAGTLDWFALLQSSRLLGLVLLDLFDILEYLLVGLLFLALFGALRRIHESAMTVAVACDLVGVGVYLASNQAFSMAALSAQYAAASTDAQRAMLLAAGEALLAIHAQGGIPVSLLLVALAGLIVSLVMRRSAVFSRATASAGLVANTLVLGYFAAVVVAPAAAFLFPSISAPFRLIWYFLTARKLLRLGRSARQVQS